MSEYLELLTLSTMTLATAGASGQPHATPVYFAALLPPKAVQAPLLYFFSEADARHSRELERDARAAASIYPESHDWQEIRGLQLHGWVSPARPGAEWNAGWEAYQQKFPFVAGLKIVVARNRFYIFHPTWIRLVDNSRRFGFRQEWSFE